MCVATFRQIVKVMGNCAVMSDGRRVRLGRLPDTKPGDWLEVYADLAVAKVNPREIEIKIPGINRNQGNVS